MPLPERLPKEDYMRRYLVGLMALVLGLAVAGTAIGGGVIEQKINGPKIKPTKLNKKKKKKATLTVRTFLENAGDGDDVGPIPNAELVSVDFTKNLSFHHKATPTCNVPQEELENTTREVAIGLCGARSKVSVDGANASAKGTLATALLPFGPGGTGLTFPVDVIAFNGGKGSLILWTRVTALFTTTILPGELKSAPGKKFGTRLAVTVPPLAGGIGRLSDFQVQIDKKTGYVKANCKANKKKHVVKGTFEFSNAPTEVVKDSSKIKKCNKNK
jgi:hypothetical protein